MRHLLCACLLALASQAWADDAPAVAVEAAPAVGLLPPPVMPIVPPGYVFDAPEFLVAQRLWGITHGVRLLGLACARHGQAAAAEAWVDWQEREATEIQALNARLGEHYFGRAEASPDVLATMLGLRQSLDLSPAALDAACDTLGAALAQPRYDLKKRREELLAPPPEDLPKQ